MVLIAVSDQVDYVRNLCLPEPPDPQDQAGDPPATHQWTQTVSRLVIIFFFLK